MIGYLDRKGNFYSCESYNHISFSNELCVELKLTDKDKLYGLEGEDILLKQLGWCIFTSRSVGMNVDHIISNEQKYFLLDYLDKYKYEIPDSKINNINDLLKRYSYREN